MHLTGAFPVFTAINKGREGGLDNQVNCPLRSRLRKQWQEALSLLWVLGCDANPVLKQATLSSQDQVPGKRSRFAPGLPAVASLGLQVTLSGPSVLRALRMSAGAEVSSRLRPTGPPWEPAVSLGSSYQLPGYDRGDFLGAQWGNRWISTLPSAVLLPTYQSGKGTAVSSF